MRYQIIKDAIAYRRQELLNRLSEPEKINLAIVDQYIAARDAARTAWQEYFDNKTEELLVTANQQAKVRDALAEQIAHDKRRYQPGILLYRIREEHLTKSLQAQACRERIRIFKDRIGTMAERIALAEFIVEEKKAHHVAITELGIEWRAIYRYANIDKRVKTLAALDPQEAQDSRCVQRYLYLRGHIGNYWRTQQAYSPIAIKTKERGAIQTKSSERDYLAAALLRDYAHFSVYLEEARLSEEKLQTQAKQHVARVAELQDYAAQRQQAQKLFQGIAPDIHALTALAAQQDERLMSWYCQWQTLTQLAKKYLRLPKYAHAIAEAGLSEALLQADTEIPQQFHALLALKLGKKFTLTAKPAVVDTIKPSANAPRQDLQQKPRWDAAMIRSRLLDQVEAAVQAAVNPARHFNHKLSNGTTLVWGKKRGSLRVTLSGPHAGWWKDFEGKGGRDVLSFIQSEMGLDFAGALDWSAHFLGLSADKPIALPPKIETPKSAAPDQKVIDARTQKKIKIAKNIWQQTRPVSGTLAARYLHEHRGFIGVVPASYRFHPAVKNFEDGLHYPALVVSASDLEGQVQAIQSVFLDRETAKKAASERPKQTLAPVTGHGVWLSRHPHAPVALVEGPETALSVFAAKGQEWSIVCTLSVNNFKTVQLPKDTHDIILVADNDGPGSNSERNVEEAAQQYAQAGKDVWLVKPVRLGDDANDVHVREGLAAVEELLAQKTLYKPALHPERTFIQLQQQVQAQTTIQAPVEDSPRVLAWLGELDKALGVLDKEGRLQGFGTPEKTARTLLEHALKTESIAHTAVLALTAEDQQLLNTGARYLLKQQQRLTRPHTLALADDRVQEMCVGEKVRFTRAYAAQKVEENAAGIVEKIQGQDLTVKLLDGRSVSFKLEDHNALDYGYVTPTQQADKNHSKAMLFIANTLKEEGILKAIQQTDDLCIYWNRAAFASVEAIQQALAQERQQQETVALLAEQEPQAPAKRGFKRKKGFSPSQS